MKPLIKSVSQTKKPKSANPEKEIVEFKLPTGATLQGR